MAPKAVTLPLSGGSLSYGDVLKLKAICLSVLSTCLT